MKPLFLFMLILCCCFFASGQEEKFVRVIDEITISGNRSAVADDDTRDRFGGGVEIVHSFFAPKRVNLNIGVGYDFTSQYKEEISGGRNSTLEDVTCYIHNLSFPINLRINFGQKIKFFPEIGFFPNFILYAKQKGVLRSWAQTIEGGTNTRNVNESILKLSYPNIGVAFGLGVKIPIQKIALVVKADYKWILNEFYDEDNLYNRYYRLSVGINFVR